MKIKSVFKLIITIIAVMMVAIIICVEMSVYVQASEKSTGSVLRTVIQASEKSTEVSSGTKVLAGESSAAAEEKEADTKNYICKNCGSNKGFDSMGFASSNPITINRTIAETETGQTLQLTVDDVFNEVKWASDNEAIASVDKNGLVSGRSCGVAEITAKDKGGNEASCLVHVKYSGDNSFEFLNDLGSFIDTVRTYLYIKTHGLIPDKGTVKNNTEKEQDEKSSQNTELKKQDSQSETKIEQPEGESSSGNEKNAFKDQKNITSGLPDLENYNKQIDSYFNTGQDDAIAVSDTGLSHDWEEIKTEVVFIDEAELAASLIGEVTEIDIPAEYGSVYSVTCYGEPGWMLSGVEWRAITPGSKQAEVHEKWIAAGAQYTNGIATIGDRYLVATTANIASVGSYVTFICSNGYELKCIVADSKGSAQDAGNMWGHASGDNVVEFEVDPDYYRSYGNPGSADWFPEIAGGVTKAIRG